MARFKIKNELLNAALTYAAKGWKVLPLHNPMPDGSCSCSKGSKCTSIGKHPRTLHATADATTDEVQIREWWTRHPEANVGIATGPDSGITIVDVDPRNGGIASYEELIRKYGDLPSTPTVTSGGDGLHHYFTAVGYGDANGNPGFVDGIDFKGNKGIIVAPPSLHASGKRYAWQDGKRPSDLALADPPAWLLSALKESKAAKTKQKFVEQTEGSIPEGKRNDTLFDMACAFARSGLRLSELFAALQSINVERCTPPLEESEVKSIADSAAKYGKEDDGTAPQRKSQSTMLVELVDGMELFVTPDHNCFAAVPVGGHFETMNLTSRAFKDYLAMQYYVKTGGAPGSNATADALSILRAKALVQGKHEPIFIRLGGSIDDIYIDLGDKDWTALRITKDGWSLTKKPAVKFYRAPGMNRLPDPAQAGNANKLKKYLNIASDEDWLLVVSWLLTAFLPIGPYPILILLGEQGCAKSTTTKVLRSLIDPASPSTRAPSKDEESLLVSARNGWIISLDNLSGLKPDMSDALCRLATGAGLSTREYYTNGGEFLIEAQRPIILNGINEISSRPDLLNRSLVVTLPVIPEKNRRPEGQFWQEFERDKPEILAGLLSIIVAGLSRRPTLQIEAFPRMADFALWASACEEALGFTPGTFQEVFGQNQASANFSGIEANPVAQAVIKFMEGKARWIGTASALLIELNKVVGEPPRFSKYWPQQPNHLSNALTRIAPLLRPIGIDVKAGRDGKRHAEARLIVIEKRPESPSRSSPPAVVPDDDDDDPKPTLPPRKARLASRAGATSSRVDNE